MIFELYSEVALTYDMPAEGLRRGDVATVVEHLPTGAGEDGYILEVFNAVGETVKVIPVPASALDPLMADDVWSVRSLIGTAR
jgi:hypothetical protein